jgi:hypothetical protein
MQKQLQSNKLMQWGMLFLVAGIAVRVALVLGHLLAPYAGIAIFAGIVLLVIGLVRGK